MYLKSLKVAGFKSFADRTRLEFRPGVAVLVGPNGSGKSNLVDAIHWVLGTQAPTTLRTAKMEDVIFAGTATRPSLGRAEVTVIFDNADRQMALDLDEVSLTRRLYRDGSSDYEINGVNCRLLDVQELLSDSGVGRHQHIIVNQGQVDAILNAGPDEHRAVIEEAAGILKHRLRQERAMRRLERTDQDLRRLNDVLAEVERQMRPLRRQAEAAERQQQVASQVRALTLFMGGEALRGLDHRLDEMAAEVSELRDRSSAAAEAAIIVAGTLRQLTTRAATLGELLERESAAAVRMETALERVRRVAQVAHERHRSKSALVEGVDERRRDLALELESSDAEVALAASDEAAATGLIEEHQNHFRIAEDEERSLVDQENLPVEGAWAVVQGDLLALRAAEQRDRREIDSVTQRIAMVAARRLNEIEERVRLDDEIRNVDQRVSLSQASYDRAGEIRRDEQKLWEGTEAEHNEKRLEAVGARARLEAVKLAADGIDDSEAREMVGALPGYRGSMSDLLAVPSEWAAAVDAALGVWSEALAFNDRASLEQAVGRLKHSGRGGLALIGSSPGHPGTARQVAAANGLDALADLFNGDALVEDLLGDVVVVEGWAAGWSLVGRHPTVRAVTPEGDLITRDGIVVAKPDATTPGLAEEAAAALARIDLELARLASRFAAARRQFETSRQQERVALEELESLEAKLAGAAEALGRANRAIADLDAELIRLEERQSALSAAIAGRAGQIERLTATVAALDGREAERQRLVEDWTSRRRQLAAVREEARAAWQHAASTASAAAERKAVLETRRQVIEQEMSRGELDSGRGETFEHLALIETLSRRAIDVMRQQVEALRDRQDLQRSEARSVGEALAASRAEHDDRQLTIEGCRVRLSDLAIEQTEARVRRESVVEGLARDLDAGEEEALSGPRPELDGEAPLHETLLAKQAELRRMGPVNPLAGAEYRTLSERHEFMTAQLTDLESSRLELRKVMKAMDEEIKAQFLAAFAEISAAYQEHFGVLFPGGRGRMRLTEPDQPLTSGVEIEAQPMGKKIARLSLLSGGEKSLAALAFLFGVFRARPSPFYILDEVEAALDDSNLRRFLRLVDAFGGESQLVLVTHQQQTMEAADVLYGVTMEPGGSSQVIAKELATSRN
ncbi:MAG: chromosome segregation protein SMC [Actinomycetota bacterium]